MKIDHQYSDRYLIVYDDGRIGRGWPQGIEWTQREASPPVHLDHDVGESRLQRNGAEPFDLAGRWPDTEGYKNIPDVMARAQDLDTRCYTDDLQKAFWLNVARVPLSVSYLAACALVQPTTILELGTGGDSAHSTGMFLRWLRAFGFGGRLVSVDRHYLSHAWLRYRDNPIWTFLQGDSVHVMKQLRAQRLPLPSTYDLIFIDSSHLYKETLAEIHQASLMTDAILFDDTNVPEVRQALNEFLADHPAWLQIDVHPGVTFIERHEYLPAA